MIVTEVVAFLRAEVVRLEQAIAALEALPPPIEAHRRRGRKRFSESERREAAERMKEYWARRREMAEKVPGLDLSQFDRKPD